MPGLGVRSPSSFGVGIGVGGSAAAAPNPNLLLWSEQMQQAVWTVPTGSVTVTADAGAAPTGPTTADDLAFGVEGSEIGQTSTVAATTGSPATLSIPLNPGAWPARISLSGSFDGVTHVLSVWLQEPGGGGSEIELRLERVGGFLRAALRDVGFSPTVRAWGWKLETPGLTAYVVREGS